MTDEPKNATTFKAGDRVRRVRHPHKGLTLGYETTVFAADTVNLRVKYEDGADCPLIPQFWQKIEDAPPVEPSPSDRPAIVDELKAVDGFDGVAVYRFRDKDVPDAKWYSWRIGDGSCVDLNAYECQALIIDEAIATLIDWGERMERKRDEARADAGQLHADLFGMQDGALLRDERARAEAAEAKAKKLEGAFWRAEADAKASREILDVADQRVAELEAGIARLREALKWAIADIEGRTNYKSGKQHQNAIERARDALGAQGNETKMEDKTPVRVCPMRDAVCPHGIDCPFTEDRYACKPGWDSRPMIEDALAASDKGGE